MYNDNSLLRASVSNQCLPVAPAMSDHKEHLVLRLLNSTGHYNSIKFLAQAYQSANREQPQPTGSFTILCPWGLLNPVVLHLENFKYSILNILKYCRGTTSESWDGTDLNQFRLSEEKQDLKL